MPLASIGLACGCYCIGLTHCSIQHQNLDVQNNLCRSGVPLAALGRVGMQQLTRSRRREGRGLGAERGLLLVKLRSTIFNQKLPLKLMVMRDI